MYCFVVKPAQRDALASSTDETRHCRLHTHTQDRGREMIAKDIQRRRERRIYRKKRGKENE